MVGISFTCYLIIYNIMLRFIFLIGLSLSVLSAYHPIIYGYPEYLSAWTQLKPKIINASSLSTQKQKCRQRSCDFVYYLYEDKQLQNDKERNKTVLLVGGLRGDDHLGSAVILNLYGQLRAARIIYFPVANPSGFDHKIPQTFPDKIEIQKDFPLIGAAECNQSSAVKILEHIFRMYSIDLTLYIQGGQPGFRYSWTTNSSYKTVQQDKIYTHFYQHVKQIYQKHSVGQEAKEFKVLNTTQPFVDWAYGASRYPNILLPTCNGVQYKKYGQKDMKGLALTVSVGEIRDSVADESKSYQSMLLGRAVQMVKYLVGFVNPRLQVRCLNYGGGVVVQVRLLGCGNAYLKEFKMMDENGVFMSMTSTMFLSGGEDEWSSMNMMGMKSGKVFPEKGMFEASYVCDNDWIGLGSTMFGQKREYHQSRLFELTNKTLTKPVQQAKKQQTKQKVPDEQKLMPKAPKGSVTQISDVNSNPTKQPITKQQPQSGLDRAFYILKIVGACLLGLVLIFLLVNCCLVGLTLHRSRYSKDFREKFEQVEYVESTQEEQHFPRTHQLTQLSST